MRLLTLTLVILSLFGFSLAQPLSQASVGIDYMSFDRANVFGAELAYPLNENSAGRAHFGFSQGTIGTSVRQFADLEVSYLGFLPLPEIAGKWYWGAGLGVMVGRAWDSSFPQNPPVGFSPPLDQGESISTFPIIFGLEVPIYNSFSGFFEGNIVNIVHTENGTRIFDIAKWNTLHFGIRYHF